MDLGGRLRQMRESKEMSIYRLSQITGISQGHISDLENGKNQPTVDTLVKLLEPIGIELSEFFNENGEVSVLNDREKELVENYRALPDDKAELYFQLGKALKK